MDLSFSEKMKQLRDIFYPYMIHSGKEELWIENTPKEAIEAFKEFQKLYIKEKHHEKY